MRDQIIIPRVSLKIPSPPSTANLLPSADTACSLHFRSTCFHSYHNHNSWSSVSSCSSHRSSAYIDNPCHWALPISLEPISEAGWLAYHKSTWKVVIGSEVPRVDDFWLVHGSFFPVETAVPTVGPHERGGEVVSDEHVQRIKNIDGVAEWKRWY